MSGHSKWSTIKRKKGALDAKRGKIFSKFSKEITIAAKDGGEPDMNPRLRLAIQNAKGVNMPKDNIERAIKKGSVTNAEQYFELTFEGYGAKGVAIFVECLTDNQNRTVQNVRSLFNKYGGNLGTNGSLEFIFDRKGVFSFVIPEAMEKDDLEMELIDGGAEEVEIEEGYVSVSSAMEDFGNLNKKLESLKIEAESAELQRIPNTMVSLSDEEFPELMKLVDALEDDDDVQKVYHSVEITEHQIGLI
jgi:YebC/PmpR family DNA-binding regulatory protein